MTSLIHTLSDGIELTVEINRRAKKNLIIRPIGTHTVRISVPPCFSVSALNRWLYENEAVLRRTLAKTPPHNLTGAQPAPPFAEQAVRTPARA
ncbi:hypothetical protein M678_11995, partial [Neisseria gonorrhoeae SK7461]